MSILKKLFSNPYFYLVGWLLINLIQGSFTLLGDDEAYYWQCAQNLKAGYFHQPPGVKWFIRAGYSIFQNELGVRFIVILLSTLTHFFLWKIVDPKNLKLYFILVFSSILVHFGGFYVAPDVLMLFFATAFLYAMKKYIEKDSWMIAILIGLLAAGIAYSKYHGAVVVIPAILVNWRLFKRPSFWLIPIVGIALFIPHIQWQIAHDFITFKFHLLERSPEGGLWYYPLHFLLSILVIHGPLLSIFLFTGAFKEKSASQYDRTLKWVMYSVLLFFLYMSLQTRIEANWTAALLIPVIYFGYRFIETRPKLIKWSFRLGMISLVLAGIFRVWLIFDFTPSSMDIRNEFHDYDIWAQEISSIADGRPVVFVNTYQKTSKFNFYSNGFGHSISSMNHGGDEFNIMYEEEESLQGKEVMFVSDHLDGWTLAQLSNDLKIKYQIIPNFRSFNRIEVKWVDEDVSIKAKQKYELEFMMINPTQKTVSFIENEKLAPRFTIESYLVKELSAKSLSSRPFPCDSISAGDTVFTSIEYIAPDEPGEYRVRAGIKPGFLFPERNGVINIIEVEK